MDVEYDSPAGSGIVLISYKRDSLFDYIPPTSHLVVLHTSHHPPVKSCKMPPKSTGSCKTKRDRAQATMNEKIMRAQDALKEKRKSRAALLKFEKRKKWTAAMWETLDALPDDLQVEEDDRGIVGGLTAAWTQGEP